MQYIIVVPIILMSIIIHEVSHGLAALWLGDDTAKRHGRLSLNPIKHIDVFGTILLPLLLLISTGGRLVFGYAKPVPINPYNFQVVKRDTGLSAAAGPISNLLIATIFAVIVRLVGAPIYQPQTMGESLTFIVFQTSYLIVFFNLLLAFFNLIPMPPLDGSKVLGIFLPDNLYYPYMRFERKGLAVFMGIILVSYVFGWNVIGRVVFPPINFFIRLLTGYGLY